jgi:ADP-heptose:LPS heptosyltransferase
MVLSLHWLRLWAGCAGRVWEVVVDLRNAPMSWLLATRRRHRLGARRPALNRVLQLAEVLALADTPPVPMVWLTEEHRQTAARLVPDGPPVLAIGPTANWRPKMWPAERFVELIGRLTAADGILPGGRIAIFGRDDERPTALGLIEAIPAERRIDLVGRVDLLSAAACLERCALFIGNDSGLMHLAAATKVPTLGLFGPSPEVYYAPWGPLTAVARTSVPYDRIFPPDFDHRTAGTLMESLSVDVAEEVALRLWARALEIGR